MKTFLLIALFSIPIFAEEDNFLGIISCTASASVAGSEGSAKQDAIDNCYSRLKCTERASCKGRSIKEITNTNCSPDRQEIMRCEVSCKGSCRF